MWGTYERDNKTLDSTKLEELTTCSVVEVELSP